MTNNPLSYTDPTGHCRRDKDGNFEYAEDCSLNEWEKLDWDGRLQWIKEFVDKHHLDSWFGDVKGVIEMFGSDSNFNSKGGWAWQADAGVLHALQSGMRRSEGKALVGSDTGALHDAADAWGSFFTMLTDSANGGNRSIDSIVSQRLHAEQVGADYGEGIGDPATRGSRPATLLIYGAFKLGADIYRSAVPSLRTPIGRGVASALSITPLILDPRTSWSPIQGVARVGVFGGSLFAQFVNMGY